MQGPACPLNRTPQTPCPSNHPCYTPSDSDLPNCLMYHPQPPPPPVLYARHLECTCRVLQVEGWRFCWCLLWLCWWAHTLLRLQRLHYNAKSGSEHHRPFLRVCLSCLGKDRNMWKKEYETCRRASSASKLSTRRTTRDFSSKSVVKPEWRRSLVRSIQLGAQPQPLMDSDTD